MGPLILKSTGWMEVSAWIHPPDALLRKNAVCVYCVGGWEVLRAGMDALKKRKSIVLAKAVIH